MHYKKTEISLIYFNSQYNFGDQLSKFITFSLINKDKYELVYNKKNNPISILCIGSYIHCAENNSFIFGSGIRTENNSEGQHAYSNLNVCAVRGPLTKLVLEKKGIIVPNIFGDPALLLPFYYKPIINVLLNSKIGLVPHKSNYKMYLNNIDLEKFYLIDPTNDWEIVINNICSCKAIVSSSLHGLICSDAYNIPNLWIDEFKLQEGDFKFKDYFSSQNRQYVKINSLNEYNETLLYKGGNKIDLQNLLKVFPFS